VEAFAESIVGGSLNLWIQETYWLWPVMEISHFIGLSLLLGGLLVIDLRMAGHFRSFEIVTLRSDRFRHQSAYRHTLFLWRPTALFGEHRFSGQDGLGGTGWIECCSVLLESKPDNAWLGCNYTFAPIS